MVEPISTVSTMLVKEVGKKLLKETVNTFSNEIAKASDDESLQVASKQFNKAIAAVSASKGGAGLDQSDNFGSKSDIRMSSHGNTEMINPSIEWKNEIKLPGELRYEAFVHGMIGRNDGIKVHPKTEVPFAEKEILNPETGEKEIHSFPIFKSEFEATLLENLYKASDPEQFAECNKQLKDWCEKNPGKVEKIFSKSQLEEISVGKNPYGYTWHHHEDTGKMQLVDKKIHKETGHNGGKAIWGGGTENR